MTPNISFEFFPPRSLGGGFQLWETVNTLVPLDPSFVSVTYGAGGTTRQLTHEAVETIHNHYGVNVAAHLTCVDATREETLQIAKSYADAGVRQIVALRGDPPKSKQAFEPHPEGFADSLELISALAGMNRFDIRVGAYPEKHPEAASNDDDIAYLKRKFDAGATSAITQFFFDAETFFRFRDRCDKAGIVSPIIPGILPIESWSSVRRFAARCGANIPAQLAKAFENAERDGTETLLSLAVATELCSELVAGGVEDLHFYTLNKPQLTREICHALGITPRVVLENVA